jgi:hypothetical protein
MLYLSNQQMNKNLPTLISFQGGSAGDLFTASLNGITLDFHNQKTAKNPSLTIKNDPVRSAADIQRLIENRKFDYISTHDFDLLLGSNLPWINVVVADPETQNYCILRQMYLQILHIQVDQSSNWYLVVKNLCERNKHRSAAAYWLEQARRLWSSKMQQRIQHQHQATKTVCFDRLFAKDFTHSISQQGIDCETLSHNHAAWLEKNSTHNWNQNATIESMTNKLSQMNWQQTTGWVRYGT